jgi:hypothetical protein
MSEDPFLTLVAEALASAGRDLEVDAEQNAIDVSSDDPQIESVLAIVRPIARGVTFYVVHPTLVPLHAYADVGDYVLQSTVDRLDATLEVDVAAGSVAYRMPVILGDLELDVETLGRLLIASVEAVEATSSRYRGPLDAVIAGELTATAAVAQARHAPIEELQAELDELEGR